MDTATAAAIQKRKVQQWGTLVCLCMLCFLVSLELAVMGTALPTIISEIGGGVEYIWVATASSVASLAVQPLIPQLAKLFSRRITLVCSVMAFALGCGIAGSAHSPGVLIAGRTLQGVGSGGMNVMLDLVWCDVALLPALQRSSVPMIISTSVATTLGPLLGGTLSHYQWRSVFYTNVPLCGLVVAGLLLFTQGSNGAADEEELSFINKLRNLHILDTLIIAPSLVAVLLGLVHDTTRMPRGSWRSLLPIVLGILGWIGFHTRQLFVA
jgi:MFS family permease